MPVQTTNVTVSAASFDSTVPLLDCTTVSVTPLYMQELVIEGIKGLGAASPTGTVRPGTAQHGATHTIYVDSTDPLVAAPRIAPFTLTITYDTDKNYKVLSLSVLQQSKVLFDTTLVQAPSPTDAADFMTQVLAALYPPAPAVQPAVANGGGGNGGADATSAVAYGTA
jgi:hypothetical protein